MTIINEVNIPRNCILRDQYNLYRRVSLVDGFIKTNEIVQRTGLYVSIQRGGRRSIATSDKHTYKELRKLINVAEKNMLFIESNNNCVPQMYFLDNGNINYYEYNDITQLLLVKIIREIDEYIMKTCYKIESRKIMVHIDNIDKKIRIDNSFPAITSTIERSCFYFELSMRNQSGVLITVSGNCCKPIKLLQWSNMSNDYEKCIDELYYHLTNKVNAIKISGGEYPCILHPYVTGILVHETIGHNTEADIFSKGTFLDGKKGTTIASEIVNVTDFAYECFGQKVGLPLFYDDEGVKCKDVRIIDHGKFVGLMHSKKTALQSNEELTGNARAYLPFDEPLVRMRNTCIHPGKDELQKMISSIQKGYYLITPTGGQADSNGSYIFSVNVAYEIEDGEIKKAINDAAISGNVIDTLKTINMISSDLLWDISGLCGKGQSMILASGGPYIKCSLNINTV